MVIQKQISEDFKNDIVYQRNSNMDNDDQHTLFSKVDESPFSRDTKTNLMSSYSSTDFFQVKRGTRPVKVENQMYQSTKNLATLKRQQLNAHQNKIETDSMEGT